MTRSSATMPEGTGSARAVPINSSSAHAHRLLQSERFLFPMETDAFETEYSISTTLTVAYDTSQESAPSSQDSSSSPPENLEFHNCYPQVEEENKGEQEPAPFLKIKPATPETKAKANAAFGKFNNQFLLEFRNNFIKEHFGQQLQNMPAKLPEDIEDTYLHILEEVIEVLTWMKMKNGSENWSIVHYSNDLPNSVYFAAVNVADKIGYDNERSAHQRGSTKPKEGCFTLSSFDVLERRVKSTGDKIAYTQSAHSDRKVTQVVPIGQMTIYVPIYYGTRNALSDKALKNGVLRPYLEGGAHVVLYFGPFGSILENRNVRKHKGIQEQEAWFNKNYATIQDAQTRLQKAKSQEANKKVGCLSMLQGYSDQILGKKEKIVGLHEGELYQQTRYQFYSYLLEHPELCAAFFEDLANDVTQYLFANNKYSAYKAKPVANKDQPMSMDPREVAFFYALSLLAPDLRSPDPQKSKEAMEKMFLYANFFAEKGVNISIQAAMQMSLQAQGAMPGSIQPPSSPVPMTLSQPQVSPSPPRTPPLGAVISNGTQKGTQTSPSVSQVSMFAQKKDPEEKQETTYSHSKKPG